MLFNLAVAGDLPQDSKILRQIDEYIGQIKGYLYTQKEKTDIRVLVSTSYTGGIWLNRMKTTGFSISGYCLNDVSEQLEDCDKIIWKDTFMRNVMGEAVCDKADLLLIVWNEDIMEFEGATWELMQMAHNRKTPCIWISSKTSKVYFSKESYYEEYNPDHLKKLCEAYHYAGIEPGMVSKNKVPLLKLGITLREKYLRKYNALNNQNEADKDSLLLDSFSVKEECSGGENLRKSLLEYYKRFDGAAIEFNSRYQAVLYWRAILPIITTIFLAVGFYVETIFGIFPLPQIFLAVAAGIGFLIHGLLNLYVYFLSRSNIIHEWHRDFIDNRYMAEFLRVLLHFLPYGVSLNVRKLCGENKETYMGLRRIMDNTEPAVQEINKQSISAMLSHVEEMLEDQISYHKVSAERYNRILKKLNQWSRWIFGIGLAAVLLRSMLQFVIPFIEMPFNINGIALKSFVRSFANMVALLLPAWASYFSSKATQCNFKYNYENHNHMIAHLSKMLGRIKIMREDDKDIPVEAVNTLAEELAEIMLIEDTGAWHLQYTDSTIKHL